MATHADARRVGAPIQTAIGIIPCGCIHATPERYVVIEYRVGDNVRWWARCSEGCAAGTRFLRVVPREEYGEAAQAPQAEPVLQPTLFGPEPQGESDDAILLRPVRKRDA